MSRVSRLVFLLSFAGCCGSQCSAESVVVATTYRSQNGTIVTENGTATAIHSSERGTILLTCRHVVAHAPDSVWISHDGGDWVQCSHVLQHPTEDIATMECSLQIKSRPLIDDVPQGAEVVVDGAGPMVHRSGERWYFAARRTETGLVSAAGLAVITGDSGGPVYTRAADGTYAIGGIAFGYPSTTPAGLTRRTAHARYGSVTLYTPCRAFLPWIQTQYCQQGNCPIQIRPQVIQPLGPLGFPRGKPRVIGIAEPIPQQYVPVPPAIRPMPDPISMTGPRGPAGPPGPPGHDGRSVQKEEVEACVNAWLDSNIDKMRGPQGPPGVAGKDGTAVSSAALELRIKTLEERGTRVIWADAKTMRTLDDETYAPGKPIVLKMPRSLQAGN